LKKIILFFTVILLISACSSIPNVKSDLQFRQWKTHQARVDKIESWSIKGRAAIQSENNSATFLLHWDQFNSDYELRFISSLGQGTYLLKGTEDGVVMTTPKNKIFTSDTPENLIREKLGWDVDLTGLKYWVRGVPEPNVRYSQLLLDEKGRLQDMKQSGFFVSILRYTDKENFSLPEKLFIRSNNIQLRLVIQNWEM
tara:strand:- start:354 stop:947 length:594 start_codon:yes stop_codon:yes gene_type:complete